LTDLGVDVIQPRSVWPK